MHQKKRSRTFSRKWNNTHSTFFPLEPFPPCFLFERISDSHFAVGGKKRSRLARVVVLGIKGSENEGGKTGEESSSRGKIENIERREGLEFGTRVHDTAWKEGLGRIRALFCRGKSTSAIAAFCVATESTTINNKSNNQPADIISTGSVSKI